MVNDIKVKLQVELCKKITEEIQVVYILSRIRKILEIDGKKQKFKKLKFYCDWALHSKVDDIEPMKEEIQEFLTWGPIDKADLLGHGPIDNEFKEFLSEYGMTTTIYENSYNLSQFKKVLTQIYHDTPIIVRNIKKTKITLRSSKVGDVERTGYSIIDVEEEKI